MLQITTKKRNELEKDDNNGSKKNQEVSDYKKERLKRIKKNNAIMEALGLHNIAKLMVSSRKQNKCKAKEIMVKEDDLYRPFEEEGDFENGGGLK